MRHEQAKEEVNLLLNNLMAHILTALKEREEGQTMVEYALLLVFIALVALVGVTALGIQVDAVFNGIVGDLGG
jgi:pilus assembly protein Flp/PilA